MAGSIGMMNEAYFLSKATLIDWVNVFLEVRIEKVEQMATGALYCNIFDALHPRSIPMNKVDFGVKYDYEYSKNWKLLQNAFLKVGIKKMIPVERLIKARYQDNLEFLQWFYKYAHDTYSGDCDNPDYDALGRREKSKGGSTFTGSKKPLNKFNANNSRRSSQRAKGKENLLGNARPPSARNTHKVLVDKKNVQSQRSSFRQNNQNNNNNNDNNGMGLINDNSDAIEATKRELEELKLEHSKLLNNNETINTQLESLKSDHNELRTVAKDIEKERDFYFNKVLEVEALCKQHSDQSIPLLSSIYNILYQTDAQEGTEAPAQGQGQGQPPTEQDPPESQMNEQVDNMNMGGNNGGGMIAHNQPEELIQDHSMNF